VLLQSQVERKSNVAIEVCFCNDINTLVKIQTRT